VSASSCGDCENRATSVDADVLFCAETGVDVRHGIRDRLSYANVMATAAVFIALGGTSYALTLPRNSVGRAQLRSDSVGRSEIRKNAVTSPAIRNRAVKLADISRGARARLRGQTGPAGPPGPAGPTFAAAITYGGHISKGSALTANRDGVNGRLVEFPRAVDGCVAVATLAVVPGGGVETPPPNGHATVAPSGDGRVLVRTWSADGQATELPFHLIVAC
jgi:hypothetical protein